MPGLLANAFYPDPRFADPRAHRISVPCPLDQGSEKEPWWADRIASLAPHLRRARFDWVLWPPLSKGGGGTAPTATGYDCYDPYDLGSKNQRGGKPTRFGDAEQIQRAIAILRRNGIPSWADMALHQRSGGSRGNYAFVGANGVTDAGRWPLNPACIRGGVDAKTIPPYSDADPVPDPSNDFPFGDECVYEHSEYMQREAKRWAKWFVARLCLGGVRIDDCKGLWIKFIRDLLNQPELSNLRAMGEYFDGNPTTLSQYSWKGLPWYPWGGMGGRMSMLDFSVHDHLQAAFDGGSGMWGLRQGATFASWDGYHAVPFADTPDTDNSPGQQLVSNKRSAYAYLLQHSLGDALVYWRDYADGPNNYGLGGRIDNMLWCNQMLCGGAAVDRYISHDVLVTERLGHQVGKPGSLAAINLDGWNDQTVDCQTEFGAYRHLHDYNGQIPDVYCDRNGRVQFKVPHNDSGAGNGHVCLGPAGVEDGPLAEALPTTMVFEGAADLDIAPIGNKTADICRVWCAKGSPLKISLRLANAVPVGGSIIIFGREPDDRGGELFVVGPGKQTGSFEIQAPESGWATIGAAGDGLPDGGMPFKLPVTYHATEGL